MYLSNIKFCYKSYRIRIVDVIDDVTEASKDEMSIIATLLK